MAPTLRDFVYRPVRSTKQALGWDQDELSRQVRKGKLVSPTPVTRQPLRGQVPSITPWQHVVGNAEAIGKNLRFAIPNTRDALKYRKYGVDRFNQMGQVKNQKALKGMDYTISGLSGVTQGAGMFGLSELYGDKVANFTGQKNYARYQPTTRGGNISQFVGNIGGWALGPGKVFSGAAGGVLSRAGKYAPAVSRLNNPIGRTLIGEGIESGVTAPLTATAYDESVPKAFARDYIMGVGSAGVFGGAGKGLKSVGKYLEDRGAVKFATEEFENVVGNKWRNTDGKKLFSGKPKKLQVEYDPTLQPKEVTGKIVEQGKGKKKKRYWQSGTTMQLVHDKYSAAKEHLQSYGMKAAEMVIKEVKDGRQRGYIIVPKNYQFDGTESFAGVGAVAGIEPYQDEDGKMKFRYNKEKGMMGVGALLGGSKAAKYAGANKFSSLLDQKPRFEIDDSGAKYHPETLGVSDNAKNYKKAIARLRQIADKYGRSGLPEVVKKEEENLLELIDSANKEGFLHLSDVLEHDKLFSQYPQLKNIVVKKIPLGDNREIASFSPSGKEIVINTTLFDGSPSTLLHEIQHAIQEIEGFARGGSPDNVGITRALRQELDELELFVNVKQNGRYTPEQYKHKQRLISQWMKIKKLDDSHSMDLYQRLAGELEARAVQRRMDMPADQRGKIDPYAAEAKATTGTTNPDDFITRFDGGVSNSVDPKPLKLSDLPKPEKLGDAEAGPKMARDMLSIPAQLLNRGFPQQVVDSLNNNQIKKLLDNNITPSQYKRMMELRGTQQLEANRAEAMLADETRSQFSDEMIKKINRLKVMATGRAAQAGDIETLRKKNGKLVEEITQAVREVRGEMSDEDALDFALNLPTKVQTRVQSPAELKTARQLKQELDARSKTQKIDRVDALGKPETKTAFDKRFAEANQGLRYDAPVTEYQKTRQIAREISENETEWQKALFGQHGAIHKDIESVERAAKGPKNKVNLLDWMRTPDRVMQKIGLGEEAKLLRTKYQDYLLELPENLNKVNQWYEQVGKSQDSSRKIFRFLDGEKKDIDGKTLQLSDTEKQVANEMKSYMDEWADRLGLPKDRRVAHYITHIFEKDFIQKDFDPELEKILQNKVAGSVYDPFLQQRLGKQGYIEDAFRAMDAYVKRATRKVHMDEALEQVKDASQDLDIQSWNYVKSYTDRINMRPQAIDTYLDTLLKSLPGVGYKMTSRPTAFATQKIRNWIYRGTLGLNVGSAMKNLTQGTNTYAKLGEKWTGVGYYKSFKSLITGDEELTKTGVLSDTFIQDKNISAMKRASEKLDKGLFYLFEMAEKINRGGAYYGAKSKALAEGKSEKEAIQAGIDMARDTQFTFGSVDTPVAMQGDIVKTLTQFQSFNIKQAEFLSELVKNKEYAGAVRWLGANLALITVMGDLLGMDYMDLIPSVKIGGSPFFNLAGDVAAVATNAPDEYGNERDTQDKVKLLAEDVIPFIPGGVQAKKTIQGFTANDEGGSYSKSGRLQFPVTKTSDKVIAPILGKYRTTGASRKFDEDLNVLSEKQTQMYRQLYSQDPQKAQAYYDQIIGQRKMKAGIPEKKTLGSLFGKPAMASEETAVVKDSNYYDSINEGIKSGYATPEQAYEYYMRDISPEPGKNRYEEEIRQDEIFSRLNTIEKSDNLDDASKFRLQTSLLETAGVPRGAYDYYKVAKQDNTRKTMYVLDQVDRFQSRDQLIRYLASGRAKIRNSQVVTQGVLTNLRDDGIISDAEYKQLNALKSTSDGKVFLPASKKKGKALVTDSQYRNKQASYIKKLGSTSPNYAKYGTIGSSGRNNLSSGRYSLR